MKYLILAFVLVASLQSCTYNAVPLKGKYQQGAVKSKIEEPYEKVWENVIDLIASAGYSVKIIDKASGLIIADASSFWTKVTIEDKKGKMLDPAAFIVREKMPTEYHPFPYNATAEWNLRVKPAGTNSTIISVNMHAIRIDKKEMFLGAVSTGNFEKSLIDEIISGSK